MTHTSLLDAILSSYLYGQKLKLEKNPKYKRLSFKLIAKAQDTTLDDWNIEFLRRRLFDDGFLENAKYGDPEPYELTALGIKAAQTKWYSSNEEEKRLDKEIKQQTLLSLRRSKDAKIISVFAIIVPTLISIYALWIAKQQDKGEVVKLSNQQLDSILHEEPRTKKVLYPLQTLPTDTLTKTDTCK